MVLDGLRGMSRWLLAVPQHIVIDFVPKSETSDWRLPASATRGSWTSL
jgi:hypothetical protein